MTDYKIQAINEVATALAGYGFAVYLSADKRHGFYTDGRRVVTFGGHRHYSVDFAGCYEPSRQSGTGWQIAADMGAPSSIEAHNWIKQYAPSWTGHKGGYTTPEQHLKVYGKCCGYSPFKVEA